MDATAATMVVAIMEGNDMDGVLELVDYCEDNGFPALREKAESLSLSGKELEAAKEVLYADFMTGYKRTAGKGTWQYLQGKPQAALEYLLSKVAKKSVAYYLVRLALGWKGYADLGRYNVRWWVDLPQRCKEYRNSLSQDDLTNVENLVQALFYASRRADARFVQEILTRTKQSGRATYKGITNNQETRFIWFGTIDPRNW